MKNAGLIFLALLLFGSGFLFGYHGFTKTEIIKATQEEVESLVSERFEVRLGSLHRVFEIQDDYLAFVDSVASANRIVKTVERIIIDLRDAEVETLRVVEFVDREVDCIPRISGSEYVFRFQHIFEDGLQIYGTVQQHDFAFYDAKVKKLSFYQPEKEIRIRKGFFGSFAGKLALVTFGALSGYVVGQF